MVDLTSVKGVEHYLSQTPFAASNIIPLSGGNANFTYRIVLLKPYDTNLVAPVRTVILKHAEPYVATMKDIPFGTERQDFESMAFKHVPSLTSPSPVVSVPKLYYEDHEHHVLLMSDTGDTSTTLKALFQRTPPTAETSHIIGKSLGVFLARLHNATSTLESPGSDLKAFFETNQQARRIVGQIYYGSLISNIAPENEDLGLIEPPLNLSPAELNTIAAIAKTMQDRIMTSNDVLAMGDFWPGNILVSSTPELHMDVVDWEAARPGLAGLEIGQFLAEMFSLRVFHPSSLPSVDITVSSFLAAYRDHALQGTSQQDILDIAWVAATHFGTHLATWTPRVPWGNKEQTREVVLEGLKCLFHVADRDEAWLKTSIVQGLLR